MRPPGNLGGPRIVGGLLAIALAGAMAILAVGPQTPQTPAPDAPQRAALTGSRPPKLPEDLADEVARDEKEILDAHGHPDNASAIQAAIPKAEHVLEVRSARQGDQWWETVDARQHLADLRRFSAMSEADRTELAAAWKTQERIEELSRAGKYDEAIGAILAMADTERRILGADHRDYAGSLAQLAKLYRTMGRYEQAEALSRQVVEIWKNALGGRHPSTAEGLNALALVCKAMGRYEQAEPLYREATEIWRIAYPEDDTWYAAGLNNLAGLYDEMGKYAQAEPLYRQAADIYKKKEGGDDSNYATTLNNLGQLYLKMGRYNDAEPLLQQALEIRKKTLGEEHPQYATSLSNLAFLYSLAGRPALAEPLYRQALEVLKKVIGEQHPTYATVLGNLAGAYEAMGRYQEAESLFRQALEIDKKTLGEKHTSYATDLGNLGALYVLRGRYAEAEPLLQEVVDLFKERLGEQNPMYATSLNNLAFLDKELGRYEEAERLLNQAAEIRKKTVGERHPDYAASLNNLAELYRAVGRYEQAEPLYRQSLEVLKAAVGERQPAYVTILSNLGVLYVAMVRYDQAESLLVQAADIQRKAGGETRPEYALCLNNLAAFYNATARYDKSESLLRQTLEIWRKAVGERHSIYATGLINLAVLYKSIGRFEEAEPLYRQGIDIKKEALGEQHPEYAAALQSLASLYSAAGQYQQAEPLYRQALAILQKALGEQHPAYVEGLIVLAMLYDSMGRYEEAEPLCRQAIQLGRKVYGEQHAEYAVSLRTLGEVYQLTGRYAQAEPLYRQAAEILKKTLGQGSLAYAGALFDLGTTLAATKRVTEASALLLEEVQVGWGYLTRNFPAMSDQQKRQFLARSNVLQSQPLWSLTFRENGTAETGLEGALVSKQLLFEAARQESGALRAAVVSAPPEWQAEWREREGLRRQYAAMALATMSEQGRAQPSGHSPVDAGMLHSLASQIEQEEERLRQENPAYALQARLQQVSLGDLRGALRPGEALVEYVDYAPYDFTARKWGNARYGAFVLAGASGQVAAVDLGEAAAIDALVGRFRLAVRGSIVQFAGVEPSRPQVRSSEAEIAAISSQLRALVWQPLEKQLADVRRVYLAPDGQLSLLPFEALASANAAGGWRYLAEERELVYLGTGRDLGRLALSTVAEAERPKTAVLIGNPAFSATPEELAAVVTRPGPATPAVVAQAVRANGSSTLGVTGGDEAPRLEIPRHWEQHPELAQLVATSGEQLKRLGWSVTTLTDRAAVKEAAEAVQAPRILQFATHGYILDRPNNDPQGWDNPLLRSMLIMAGANDWHPVYRVGQEFLSETAARAKGLNDEQLRAARVELGDGVLTAYEVTGMNLVGTELVNLTACETGLGEVTPDGVAGLRQAFLLAGARSLTMSMWEVPGEETTEEIRDFYERWLGGEGKGGRGMARYEAFHAAQMAALAQARESHGAGHPFYWAGVVFMGDPGDLPGTSHQLGLNSPQSVETEK